MLPWGCLHHSQQLNLLYLNACHPHPLQSFLEVFTKLCSFLVCNMGIPTLLPIPSPGLIVVRLNKIKCALEEDQLFSSQPRASVRTGHVQDVCSGAHIPTAPTMSLCSFSSSFIGNAMVLLSTQLLCNFLKGWALEPGGFKFSPFHLPWRMCRSSQNQLASLCPIPHLSLKRMLSCAVSCLVV